MAESKTLPYGSWPSPISARSIVADAATLVNLWDRHGRVWWAESRPSESGRTALLCDGVDVWPAASVRTRVHSYGGGAWWPDPAGGVYASNDADGRLWYVPAGGEPRPVSPEPDFPHGFRYADGRAGGDGTTVCVREDHHGVASAEHSGSEEANQIVRLSRDGRVAPEVLASGADFYAWPRPSPNGDRLAWVQWNHPNMPWDQTELWVDGRCVVTGRGSMVEPQWSSDGTLYVVSDHTGWWNLYRVEGGDLVAVLEMDAEVHRPAWVFDDPSYAVCDDGTVVVAAMRGSLAELWVVPADGSSPRRLDFPWTSFECLRPAGPYPDSAVTAIVASPAHEPSGVRIDVSSSDVETIRPPSRPELDPAYLSIPTPITFPTTDGAESHGLYYPPTNPEAKAPSDERPPLLVLGHGGPTGAARSQLQLGIQYWTSRGIAVVDVNYRGSTGYGTAYREAIRGLWGVCDVDDCVAAARHLVRSGEVDGDRLIIRGSSAGGYTTLCALAFHKVFAAGASRYGIADLAALAIDTHKFEARYMDSLVGPYPEADDIYRARSPIHFVNDFEAPMIVLQGSEDVVVPPNQAEMIVAALEERSIPVAYLLFEGEQHGFRRAESIVAALEAELSFFAQILGFDLADDVSPVEIRR